MHLGHLASYTGRNTIAYYSAFLSKPRIEGIDIVDDDKNAFMNCVHGMVRTKGLDLILHTPGGNVAATESLVHYLRELFGNDVRAIIPQIAMSAGTMLACSCKSILMGKQSNLGPIDPHINGIPAEIVVQEFKRAYDEIQEDPSRAHVWSPILSRYTPSFLTQCEYAVQWAKRFVQDSLAANMFASEADPIRAAENVVTILSSTERNKTHSKHFHHQDCLGMGLRVDLLEGDQKLQDLVLTVHHCYMHTTSMPAVLKIIESDQGRAIVKNVPAQMPALSIGFGSPA